MQGSPSYHEVMLHGGGGLSTSLQEPGVGMKGPAPADAAGRRGKKLGPHQDQEPHVGPQMDDPAQLPPVIRAVPSKAQVRQWCRALLPCPA